MQLKVDSPAEEKSLNDIQYTLRAVPVNDIDYGDRIREDFGDIEDLAEDISKHGLFHPICLVKKENINIEEKGFDSDKPYLLLAGGRRFRAHEFLNAEEIPANIFDRDISDEEMKFIELHENIKRKDLSWQEQVALKKQIHDFHTNLEGGEKVWSKENSQGHSIRDTAEILGESKSSTHNDIDLATAMESMPELSNEKSKGDAQKKLKKIRREAAEAELAKRQASKNAKTPLDKLRQEISNKYILQNFFEGIKEIDDSVFDLVELDPPYAIDLKKTKKSKTDQLESYNEVDIREYKKFMEDTLREAYRTMKANSWIVVWFAPEPWFEDMYQMIKRAGFEGTRMVGIWEKGIGQTMSPGTRLGNAYEMFFYARKGYANIIKQGNINVFSKPPVPPTKKIHPTERPIELIELILETFCYRGGRVLTPFAGSGNTILAAANQGMDCIGFDLAKTYKNSFTLRVNEGKPGKYKSY